jgi:HK97 family phage portal protein
MGRTAQPVKNLLSRIGAAFRNNPLESPAVSLASPGVWQWLAGGRESDSGEYVDSFSAIQVSTVFACIRILSDSISSLPLILYKQTGAGRLRAVDDNLFFLLSQEPNPESSAVSAISFLVASMCLHGNAFMQIQRNVRGNVVALYPLHPRMVSVERDANGDLVYRVQDGETAGQARVLQSKDIIHVPYLCMTSDVLGISPIEANKQSIGLARGADRFAGTYLKNFSVPPVVISTDHAIKPEDKTRMRDNFEANVSGANRHRVLIADNGLKVEPLHISAEDMQFLESRKFTRQELANVFGVPGTMLDLEKTSMASAEQSSLDFAQNTLSPWCKKIESEFEHKLLGKNSGMSIQFDLSQRLRGDYKSLTDGLATLRNWGFVTINDGRKILGLNEVGPEGDVLIVPTNMMANSTLLKTQAAASEQTK